MERSLTVTPDHCSVNESRSIEIIRGNLHLDRLYWISDKNPPRNRPNSFYICIDQVAITQDLTYEPFCADFGPLNLGMTYRFCNQLERLLNDRKYSSHTIYHYCSNDQAKRANAAYLMGAFQIIILQRSAYEAWLPFYNISPFLPFRDASYSSCTYECTIPHCLNGLGLGIKLGWFSFREFNIQDYEHYETVDNGDMNWIIPHKMLAFSCPANTNYDSNGLRTTTPEDYAAIFKRMGVTTVIRLSKKNYDSDRFIRYGIKHYDLYFPDGSIPSESIVKAFLKIAETEPGAIAVHCKAGLGRTGTLIGCYAMKHYNFPAADFIAWCRICRPGSILGPQQQFLIEMQSKLGRWPLTESSHKASRRCMSEMTVEDRHKAVYGDQGQAQRLLSAKRSHHCTPTKESYTVASPYREGYSIRDKNTDSPLGYDTYAQYRDESPSRRYQDYTPPRRQATPTRNSASYRDESLSYSLRQLPTRLFTTTTIRSKYV